MSEHFFNAAQQKAIEYTAGPLLVVAGAGTGKTTVITKKIAYLITSGLAKVEEILVLTFNDKAAAEINDRVDKLINIDYADIQISTFHAFGERLLERHGLDIGINSQFTLLTKTAAWLFIRKNLSKFNLNYYRPLGNPHKHIHELIRHFSKCKDELISPTEYLQYAESVKLDGDDVFTNDASRLAEVANAYGVYNQLLLDHALFDFGDLIFYAHKLFTDRKNILAHYQKKYKYILVDEFQDVNWAQYQLVRTLSPVGVGLTVVGDDDQSIYAFRGASVSNIMHFTEDFPATRKIVLNENYRSGQVILDAAYISIQNNNPDRLEVKLNIDKKLISRVEAKGEITRLHAAHVHEEAAAVINEIIRLKETDREASWSDFAILARANNHVDPFVNALEAKGIPFEFLSASGLFREPTVLDCLNYFKLLDNQHESLAVFRLLRLPWLGVIEEDLHTFTRLAKKNSISYYAALKRAHEFGLSETSVAACRVLAAAVEAGLRQSRSDKPSVLLYAFLERSGYLKYLIDEAERGNSAVALMIKQFIDKLIEFESINPDAHVSNLMDQLNMIMDSGDRGDLQRAPDTPEAVRILTVHTAKGLEFKYVFIINIVEERFPTRSKGEGIEIPAALVKEQLPTGDSHYQEERRLFYVGVTRAKERLYFTSSDNYGGVRAKKMSRFLTELGYSQTTAAVPAVIITKRSAPRKKDGEYTYELPKRFSFSHIQMYETCPYKYKLAHLIHLPTKGSHHFSFGITMHATLQAFYERVQQLNRIEQASLFSPIPVRDSSGIVTVAEPVKVPALAELLAIYEKKWIGEWYQSANQREEYFVKGKDVLRLFYKAQANNWTIPTFLESGFKVKIGDYILDGKIDRVDQLPDGTLEIIDYKTGQTKETLTAKDKQQLLIYQIAAEQLPEYRRLGKPSKLTFYYLENNVRTSFIGANKDLEKLRDSIHATIASIKDYQFKATPSQFACDHCDFRDICQFRI